MRRTIIAAALSAWLLPLSAFADQCADVCRSEAKECKQDCEKGDKECLDDCAESQSMCPKLCSAMLKNAGNKQKLAEEVEKLVLVQEKTGPE